MFCLHSTLHFFGLHPGVMGERGGGEDVTQWRRKAHTVNNNPCVWVHSVCFSYVHNFLFYFIFVRFNFCGVWSIDYVSEHFMARQIDLYGAEQSWWIHKTKMVFFLNFFISLTLLGCVVFCKLFWFGEHVKILFWLTRVWGSVLGRIYTVNLSFPLSVLWTFGIIFIASNEQPKKLHC